MTTSYQLNEVFASLQGEGRNTGRPVTFIRFAGCNLGCPWCDTNHTAKFHFTLTDLLSKVKKLAVPSIVITGGEPTIQSGLTELVLKLKKLNCWVALETNGLVAPENPAIFDYIAVSPKAEYAIRYVDGQMLTKANEMRIVGTARNIVEFCRTMRGKIEASDYYISPLSKHGRMDLMTATKLLDSLNTHATDSNPWKLSVQMHKLIGIK